MSSSLFLSWSQALEKGTACCGGKAWHLARLHHLGFTVPAGGVLSSSVYAELIQNPMLTPLIQRIVDTPNTALTNTTTNQYLKDIRQTISTIGLPFLIKQQLCEFLQQHQLENEPLAIRSSADLEDSASASFAGIHESYLNVRGVSAIEQAILDCFASLWTLQAVSYRRKMGINDTSLNCAVVIMALVEAHAAGVAFSCDPSTGRDDISIINANFGLGESVVNGAAEPDEYQFHNYDLVCLKYRLGRKEKYTQLSDKNGTELVSNENKYHQQVLTESDINRLGLIIQRVFWALGDGQQDIEWAYDGKTFFILQARPVTALPRYTCRTFKHHADIWSNGNLRDATPMVLNTLNLSLIPHAINTILRVPFDQVNYDLPEGIGFVKSFQGRIYCNIGLFQWLFFDGMGFSTEVTNKNFGGHQQALTIDKNKQGTWRDKLRRLWNTVKFIRSLNHYKKKAPACDNQQLEAVNALINSDLSHLSDAELLSTLQQSQQRCHEYATPFMVLTAHAGSINSLYALLEKYFPDQGSSIANTLLAGAGNITSALHGYQLQTLAELIHGDPDALLFFQETPFVANTWGKLPESSTFKQGFQKFIDDYGHRGVYEVDISNPRWREQPDYLLHIIRQHFNDALLSDKKSQQKNRASDVWKMIKQEVPFYLHPTIKSMLKQSATGAELKEMAKSTYVRFMEPLRLLFLEVGQRFVHRGLLQDKDDIFYCSLCEVIALLREEWDGRGLSFLVDTRKQQQKVHESLTAPDFINGDQPHYSEPQVDQSGSNTLTGMGVAAGCAEGVARIIYSPNEAHKLSAGDILVAPSTDPAWTPLFLNVAAIVMETGGQLSHGAIVAREYGIPAVVNVPGLLKTIHEGETLFVDGDQGKIKRKTSVT